MGKFQRILLCCLAFVFCCSSHCSAQSAAEQDVLLNYLQRQFSKQYEKYSHQRVPCFALSFQVCENQESITYVNLGHIFHDFSTQDPRKLKIAIAVGDQNHSNYHILGRNYHYTYYLPLTNDTIVLGKIIDQDMADAYQKALQDYNKAAVALSFNKDLTPNSIDFPSDTFYYEPSFSNQLYNKEEVLSKLISCTQQYNPIEDIDVFEADLEYYIDRYYYINNMGAVLVYNEPSCNLRLDMHKANHREFHTYSVSHPNDLPPLEQMMTDAEDLYETLNAKKTDEAPLLQRHYDENVESAEFFPDIIFQAMQDEISDDLNLLNFNNAYQPYYISYLVTDAHTYQCSSVLGNAKYLKDKVVRYVEPTIKIGNNILNNEQINSCEWREFGNLSLDNNYNAIRNDFRNPTENAYQKAVEEYVKKQQTIKAQNIDINKLIPNRSAADIKTDIQYKNFNKIDVGELQSITDGLSALLLQDSIPLDIATNTTVSLYIYQGNAYFASSERIQYAQPFSICKLEILNVNSCGLNWPYYYSDALYFNSLEELKDRDSLSRWANSFIQNICQLQKSTESIETYTGPVIISGRAAGKWLCLASEMLTTSQNRYKFLDKGMEQFLDQRICSSILDIQTADNLQEYNGTPLIGHSTFDAEGVIVDANMDLIRRGRLITLLNDRSPVEKIAFSNGHKRLNLKFNHLGADIGPGVLKVNSHNTLSESKLRQLLLKKAKEAGYDHVYIITDFYQNEHDEFIVIAHKISVRNGKSIGIEIFNIQESAFWSLKNVSATSNVNTVCNTMFTYYKWMDDVDISGIPTSIIHPQSLLFDHLTIGPKSAVNKN